MKLKPLADRVILKQFKAEEKTKSGLILAASAQEKPEMFEVVEVGPGGMVDGNEVKMTVAAGDRVIVGKYAKGRYRELEKFITHLEGGHLEIDSEQDLVVNIDGEALWSKHVNFDLIPGGVNFLVPANMAFFHPETTGGHETREFVHA